MEHVRQVCNNNYHKYRFPISRGQAISIQTGKWLEPWSIGQKWLKLVEMTFSNSSFLIAKDYADQDDHTRQNLNTLLLCKKTLIISNNFMWSKLYCNYTVSGMSLRTGHWQLKVISSPAEISTEHNYLGLILKGVQSKWASWVCRHAQVS